MSPAMNPSLSVPEVPYSRPTTPGNHVHRLGFVGIGAMGYFMARNLANRSAEDRENLPLLIWNRSPQKTERLLKELGPDKIVIAQNLEQIAQECDIIFTALAHDEAVKEIYETFTQILSKHPVSGPKIFVETSTIYPSLAGELDALVSSLPHTRIISSPVFGTPAVADKAQLVIIMSGDYHSKKEVAHILVPSVGRKVIDLGGNLEKAPTFKLIGNSMILGTNEIMAEAYTLAEKSGIGSQNVHQLVQDLLPAPGTLRYSDRMAHDNFDGSTGFSIDGGIKDASHIRRLTTQHNSPMPVIDVAHQHLLTAKALHTAQKARGKQAVDVLDWSAIVAGARVAAGLDGFDSSKHLGVVTED